MWSYLLTAIGLRIVLVWLVLAGLSWISDHSLDASESRIERVDEEQDSTVAAVSRREDESAAEVAREVIRLQQQLGGSIVEGRPELQGVPANPSPRPYPEPSRDMSLLPWPEQGTFSEYRRSAPAHSALSRKVSQLREASLVMDTEAHRLEELDLYEQADAMRQLATRLRRDARLMKQNVHTLPADRSPPSSPTTSGSNSRRN